LNIISDKNNVVKKVDSRTYYPRYDYDQEIRCPGSGREKAYREELRCPGIGRERAYREELRCPGIGRELAYREYLSGRPDV